MSAFPSRHAADASTSHAASGPRGALHAGGAVVRLGVEGGGARHRSAGRRPLLRGRRGRAGARPVHAVGGAGHGRPWLVRARDRHRELGAADSRRHVVARAAGVRRRAPAAWPPPWPSSIARCSRRSRPSSPASTWRWSWRRASAARWPARWPARNWPPSSASRSSACCGCARASACRGRAISWPAACGWPSRC